MRMPTNRMPVTISIKPYKCEQSGDWRVDCFVIGLKSEEQALRAADFITATLCGEQIQTGVDA